MDMFKVGDKVRVVKPAYFGWNVQLVEGRVYTVTEVVEDSLAKSNGINTYGINVDNGDGGYGSWDSDRFELVEDEQPEPTEIPTGVRKAYDQGVELFGQLAESGLLALIEGRSDQAKFVRQVAEQVDQFLISLSEEYPVLEKEDV